MSQKLTGTTQNLGVMGWPILHSLSPVLQNAALEKAGLDYVYVALPVPPEKLRTAVAGLQAMGFAGWNVTIPHKQAIMPLLDEIDEDARIIGAVNTVIHKDGRLIGHNTDVTGFLLPFKRRGIDLRGKKVALLGAGGAARAVIWGLLREGVSSLAIGVRNPRKAEPLIEEFAPYGILHIHHWEDEAFREELGEADLLVNTTPLGMTPHTDGMPPVVWQDLKASAIVYDIIYTPAHTRFLREAAAHGHTILNGEEMLAGQGAAAFALWTGQEADLDCMLTALRAELSSRHQP
ncbi:MAG: shikimate dehydrogenase [Selenomonadaceae bacterium]|nr:shikimate dehydrogenase [Selenomonadaceae bacterium]